MRENVTKFVRDGEVAAEPPICSTNNNDATISEMKRVTGFLQRQDDDIDPEAFFNPVHKILRKSFS